MSVNNHDLLFFKWTVSYTGKAFSYYLSDQYFCSKLHFRL